VDEPADTTPSRAGVDPRLRVLFLVVISVGVFFLPTATMVGIACVALAITWFVVGLPARRLARQISKLGFFVAFMLFAYSFFPSAAGESRWTERSLFGFTVRVNDAGFWLGVLMLLRVVAVLLASQIARAGDPRAIGAGLKRLHLPDTVSLSIDTVLALLGDTDRRRGDGGGRRRGAETGERVGILATFRRIVKGDFAPIMDRVQQQIERAERHIAAGARPDGKGAERARDVAVIAGVALTMLGIELIKLLPHVPLAPGHKLVFTTPLYVVAALFTRSRFGATLTGATLGTVAFLIGEGSKFGVFEILNHMVPGIITDLIVPWLVGRARLAGPIAWALLGALIAAGRFAMTLGIMVVMKAPSAAYAVLIPGLASRLFFGLASGYVTFLIVRAIVATRDARQRAVTATPTEVR
jgi:hypothetical protein